MKEKNTNDNNKINKVNINKATNHKQFVKNNNVYPMTTLANQKSSKLIYNKNARIKNQNNIRKTKKTSNEVHERIKTSNEVYERNITNENKLNVNQNNIKILNTKLFTKNELEKLVSEIDSVSPKDLVSEDEDEELLLSSYKLLISEFEKHRGYRTKDKGILIDFWKKNKNNVFKFIHNNNKTILSPDNAFRSKCIM